MGNEPLGTGRIGIQKDISTHLLHLAVVAIDVINVYKRSNYFSWLQQYWQRINYWGQRHL